MKLNQLVLSAICILYTSSSFSQLPQPSVTKVENQEFVKLLGRVEQLVKRYNGNHLAVNLFKVSNALGSANISEDDEVSVKYYISTSSADDSPDLYLFRIGDFYLPKMVSFEKSGSDAYLLVLSHVLSGKPATSRYLVKLREVVRR